MAPSSTTTSASSSSSPFPETPVALARPVHAAVRLNNYDNYSKAFSEDTSYNNSYTSPSTSAAASSSLTALTYSSRNVSAAFGKHLLSAISENVNSPAVVALSRKASFHARARSLVSFVPALNPASTEEEPPSSTSPSRNGRTLAAIFTPRRSSIAPPEDDDDDDEQSEFIMSYKSSFTAGPGRQPQQSPAPKPTGIRGFAWFTSTKTPSTPPPTRAEAAPGTDILNPATSLLFPVGLPAEKTSATFDELLQNAEFLINRLQTAYKEQASALQAARAEREAQAEESEEVSTRARHLKSQLDDLAAQSAEQAATNLALAEELAAEKQRRHEDREQYERMVSQHDLTPRRNRHSGASSVTSDSGFESEADTASSCSRPITPTSPHLHNYALNNERWGTVMRPIKEVRPVSSGRTCEIDASVWTLMRDEKTRLERRVQELEGVLDGCLDLIA
jgi:hypothetical protein